MLPDSDPRKRPASIQAPSNRSDDDWSDLTTGSGSPRFSLGSSDESPQEQEGPVVTKTDRATQYSNNDWNDMPDFEPTDEPDGDLHKLQEKPSSTMVNARSSRKETHQSGENPVAQNQQINDASGLRRRSQTAQTASTKAQLASARSREKRNRGKNSAISEADAKKPIDPASSSGDSPFSSIATQEAVFVTCVALTLVGYIIACIYSFYHPIHVPLPTLESLQQPYDVSDVALQILHPVNDSTVYDGSVHLEWMLQQFPVRALELFGPEPFHYRVYVNDVQLVSEIGFLGLTGNDELHIHDNARENEERWINATLRQRLLPRLFPTAGSYVIHVEAAFPIPGDHGRVHKLHDRVYFHKTPAATTEHRLRILSPANTSVFTHDQPVVVEYETLNLHALQVAIDGDVAIASKVRVNDGNLLLRGLGPGEHHVELRGFAATDQEAMAAGTHFMIVSSSENESH